MNCNLFAALTSRRRLAISFDGLILTCLCVAHVSAKPDLGPNASLRGYRPFPDDNPWNTPVDKLPVDARVRLKANYDISKFPDAAQVILRCLKTYGMILADNGSDWFLSGAPDDRWDNEALGALKRVKGGDFEVVQMGPLTKE